MSAQKKQYGVIPYFKQSGKLKLILITSKTSNQWIVPKGKRVPNKTKRESAILEAYEEAGVTGKLIKNLKLSFNIRSHGDKTELTLYLMCVKKSFLKDWPEKHQRKRTEVSPKRAKSLVVWPEIADCLKRLEKKKPKNK